MKLTTKDAENLKTILVGKFKNGGDFQIEALTEHSPWSRSKLPEHLKLQHLACGGKMGKKKKKKILIKK